MPIDCRNKKYFVTVAQCTKYSLVGCVHPLKSHYELCHIRLLKSTLDDLYRRKKMNDLKNVLKMSNFSNEVMKACQGFIRQDVSKEVKAYTSVSSCLEVRVYD